MATWQARLKIVALVEDRLAGYFAQHGSNEVVQSA
jgi:hypothetical protein